MLLFILLTSIRSFSGPFTVSVHLRPYGLRRLTTLHTYIPLHTPQTLSLRLDSDRLPLRCALSFEPNDANDGSPDAHTSSCISLPFNPQSVSPVSQAASRLPRLQCPIPTTTAALVDRDSIHRLSGTPVSPTRALTTHRPLNILLYVWLFLCRCRSI